MHCNHHSANGLQKYLPKKRSCKQPHFLHSFFYFRLLSSHNPAIPDGAREVGFHIQFQRENKDY